MNNTKVIDTKRHYDAVAWGALFIWWGITELVKTIPFGIGMIGAGLILLAVNAVRALNCLHIRKFSTFLGIVIFLWGLVETVGIIMRLSFELPVFAIILIAGGLLYLVVEVSGSKNTNLEV